MNQKKINVKIHGCCYQNPHGEMGISYVIEDQNGESETYCEWFDPKFGNSLNMAEYKALNKALERLIELNLKASEIEVHTTSNMILLHYLGHSRPNRGYYVKEALIAGRYLKRFHNLQITKIERKDNVATINLLENMSLKEN